MLFIFFYQGSFKPSLCNRLLAPTSSIKDICYKSGHTLCYRLLYGLTDGTQQIVLAAPVPSAPTRLKLLLKAWCLHGILILRFQARAVEVLGRLGGNAYKIVEFPKKNYTFGHYMTKQLQTRKCSQAVGLKVDTP